MVEDRHVHEYEDLPHSPSFLSIMIWYLHNWHDDDDDDDDDD